MRSALLVVLFASAPALAAERARIVREVPRHEVSLLADCPAARAEGIAHELQVAISLGAPTYNKGDFEGCYRVYSNTAVAIDARLEGCTGLRKALLFGVERAKKLRTFDEKAWAMRDAFDGVLDVIDRASSPGEAPAPAPKVERRVPKFASSMLDDCPAPNRAKIAQAISGAIDVGAPLYNEGKPEACAKLYLGTALELQSGLGGCVRVKRALDSAATQARAAKDPDAAAWMMRDVFDGLLEVLARRAKAAAEEI